MRSRPLVAVALLATLGLTAACSSDSSTRAAKISDDLTQAASTAATPRTPSGDAFPIALPDPTTRSSRGVIYPGAEWLHAEPEKLGFDPTVLKQIARAARPSQTTCLLVARKGRIVGEWNWRNIPATTPREVYSVTKSLTSTLVGLAQADGDLDIDQKAARYIREWRGSESAGVTIRNLLSNDSGRQWEFGTDYGDLPQAKNRTEYAVGLRQQYPPGQVWAYNNAAIQTLDRVISEATGSTTRDYAASRLLGPIGMTHSRMTADPAGNTNTFFGLQTTCEDLARFGYLFLRQGRWGDDQVVPRSWVGPPSVPPRRITTRPTACCGGSTARVRSSARSLRTLPASPRRSSASPRPAPRPTCSRPRASVARQCSSTPAPRRSSSASASSRPTPTTPTPCTTPCAS